MGKQVKRSLFRRFPAPEDVTEIDEKGGFQDCSDWKRTEKSGLSCDSISNSDCSNLSSSISSEFMEDATSSSSSSSSSYSNGPLYKLSDLMDQLPIKRGLSKYYQGKSESFASLASVEGIEELAKRENPYNKRMKLCKSFCGGLHDQRFNTPKGSISKKTSYSSSLLKRNCSNNLMATSRTPSISVHKDF